MPRDSLPGTAAEYCPHPCPNCGSPAYVGGPDFPAKCIEKDCIFYDEPTWVGWIMRLDDTGDPPIDCPEPDLFGDEDTNPGYFIPFSQGAAYSGTQTGRFSSYKVGPPTIPYGGYLDTYAKLLGLERLPGESDDDLHRRLTDIWSNHP